MLGLFHSLWHWRHFIASSIKNDLRARFSRSLLGGTWMLLNPLAMVMIYTLVLSAVLTARLPGIESQYAYAIYLISGMLCWTLFLEITQRCLGVFIESGNQMKKINFPRITLPVIVTGTSLLSYLLLLAITLIVFAILGHLSWLALFWLPLLTLLTLAFALGLGMILGTLNVFIRDLGQAMGIIFQLLFWFTPIVYPVSILPEGMRSLLQYNPLYHLVEGYHQVLAYQQAPDLLALTVVALLSVLLLLLGFILFRKASPEMMDML